MFIITPRQRGIATLLVTIVILMIATIMMVFSNRSALLEQKTATNQLKRAMAFDAAQSGLDLFVAKLLDANSGVPAAYMTGTAGAYTGVNTAYGNATSVLNSKGYLNSSSSGTYHEFTNSLLSANASGQNFSGVTLTAPTGSNQLLSYSIYLVDLGGGRVRVFSRGCADEVCPASSSAFAEAVVSVDVNVNGQSRCAVEVNQTVTMVNNSSVNGFAPSGKCGVAMGDANVVDGGGNGGAGKPTPPNYDLQSCDSNATNCPYPGGVGAQTPQQNGVKVNGVNTATDSYFTNYFGNNPAAIQGDSSTRTFSGNATGTNLCAEIAAATASSQRVLWITGNLTLSLSDNGGWGAGSCPQNFYRGPGWQESSTNNPVTVIVGGDLNVSTGMGALQLYGLFFVRGNANLYGSITLAGMFATEGNLRNEVSLNVESNQSWINQFKFPPVSSSGGKLTQTWRDF
ncbi:PilX N-terminal domain-containing pilus assembly protein [Chitinibacter sp. S2-10]|uniref:pilus assembly PilX family protein n=1 Tax=Chitinibacter sp. S2-10 TaxID=3373597 RepID=UPI003977C64D